MATFIGDPGGVATNDDYFDDIHNVLYGLDGDDFLIPGTPGPLALYGGDGDDVLDGAGADDEVYGGRGLDTLTGNAGEDLLEGGSGADFLRGGLDSDALYGGRGADVFSFLGDESTDRVHDFNGKEGDSIELFSSNFTALEPGEPLDPDAFFKGKNAQEGDDHIGYDQKSGKMSYDENGDESGGRILFAQFDRGTKIKASDIDVSELGLG